MDSKLNQIEQSKPEIGFLKSRLKNYDQLIKRKEFCFIDICCDD